MAKEEKNKKTIEEEMESDITINEEESSLTAFTKRPVPSEEQVEEFEEALDEEAHEEEVEESLNEIYKDDDGEMVDVKKIKIMKKRGFLFWFISVILFFGIFGGGGYAFYKYVYQNIGTDSKAVEFSIDAKTEVLAGEEFFYTVKYKNNSNVNINNVRITVKYPHNFIFAESVPAPNNEKNDVWELDSLAAGKGEEIKIKGRLVGAEDELGIISANITYTPENFSSEFKKEATLTTVINDIGIDFDFDYINTALVDKEEEVIVSFAAKENNYLNNFRLTIEPRENIEIIGIKESDDEDLATFTSIRPGVWQIDEVLEEKKNLPIRFKVLEKTEEKQKLVFNFEQVGRENEFYKFFTQELEFDIMKSDLNINLIINGAHSDQGVDFGQTLNYSIVYNNRGEAEMKNLVIMAILESDFLDWETLDDANNGERSRNTITWTKNEIEQLANLGKNQEGTIDFSIKMQNRGEIDTSKDYQVKSYAQFIIGEADAEDIKDNPDNRSNTIVNRINSDLDLDETVRYFDEDNVPVGSGPHPPKVDETTSYKVYWNINNNLHELDDLVVRTKLPAGVSWDGKNRASAGGISFDNGEVVWEVGRLPITVYTAGAEFSIAVNPEEADRNKIMVLLSNTSVQATDSETEAKINFSTKAKTTKLEDDDIAVGDGMVE